MTSCAAAVEETTTFRQALAQQVTTASAQVTAQVATPIQDVTMRQTYIWTSIILAVVLFFSVMSLLNMDLGKERDTILYAKFLRVEDGARL